MIFKNPIYKENSKLNIKNIGGIVTSLHPAFIGNDRLSDGYNVWNKNGIISSRPGICATENGLISNQTSNEDIKMYYSNFPFENVESYNNLCAMVKNLGYSGTQIDFFAIDSEGAVHNISNIELKNDSNTEKYNVKNLIFIKSKKISGCGIFVILPIHIINSSTSEERKEVQYFELSSDYNSFIKISPQSLYRPIIIKNGYGNLAPAEIRREYKESRPEGVSLLNGSFEARFVFDGVSDTFSLPTTIANDAPIEIRYYRTDTYYDTVMIEAGQYKSKTFEYLNLDIYVTVNRSTGKIYFRHDGDSFAMPKMVDVESLRILSYCDVAGADYEIFSSAVSPILFDSRLFIAGGENRGNKVYYSGKTEHLYFSEDYSVSVGNKSYDLTALSMQSKYIIAFKAREIFRLSITCTDEIPAQKLEIDSKGLVFEKPKCTVTQINDSLGCDLPDTIVTCANRLVWFHSDGVVYTLYGSNLYTEGSIYELSSDISNLLTDIPKDHLTHAFAADLNGYYALGLYNRLFLMDLRVSGFRYLSNQNGKKENKLTWFLWQSPEETCFISGFLCGGKEYFVLSSSNGQVLYTAKLSGEKDIITKLDGNEEKIPQFALSSAILGENFNNLDRISFNALIKHSAEVTVFDENQMINRQSIAESKEFKTYIIPAAYKKGSIGIKIKGSGEFKLKDIICYFKERIY